MEPKAKSSANFWGATTTKLKEREISNVPKKKAPANCASFIGDMVRDVRPCRLLPTEPSAPFTPPAALAACARACSARAAPIARASPSLAAPLDWASFKDPWTCFAFSDSPAVAFVAFEATWPQPLETWLPKLFAPSPISMDFAASETFETDFCTFFAAPFAHLPRAPKSMGTAGPGEACSPRSRSDELDARAVDPLLPPASAWGTIW
mmetsp:Transcript_54340/g.116023  ORF Transcript_54340/g.116023 Transcript_54340/m.116023 type:complete len:208 (-) Transcript_54340:639-1262(-)